MTRRLTKAQRGWVRLVFLAIVISVLPSWRNALLLCATAVVVPFNALASDRLVTRFGPAVGEGIRAVFNFAVCTFVFHLVHWPPAVFLWLPYIALVQDGYRRDIAYGVIAFHSICYAALSILDGTPWQTPFAWIVIAILCRRFTDERVRIAHDLWQTSETQRHALGRAEVELRQSQKLEAVGRLAAGVAHEINNPLQLVDSSAQCVIDGVIHIAKKVDAWRGKLDAMEIPAHVREELDREEVALDLPALRADVLDSLKTLQGGVGRVTAIVRAMKEFADPASTASTPTNINRAIDATLVVARHEYNQVADVKTELSPIPDISFQRGAISQVLLNLLVNAAQAIAARPSPAGRGTITVRSALDADWVLVSVADDGTGIPASAREKVFEPFFTTRPVGAGRGQGLAVARSIMEGHGGRITFETEVGRGTTFTLRLPRSSPVQAAA